MPIQINHQIYQDHFKTQQPSATETLEWVRPLFKKVGLTRLFDITGLDRIGIKTVLATRPNSPTLANFSGKGLTSEVAQVSAAMEAIEIFHAEEIPNPTIVLPYAELAKHYPVVPIEHLLTVKHAIFHPHNPEPWVLGWDLLNQQEVPVPKIMVSLSAEEWNARTALNSFQCSSNGLASGNHLMEALLGGLYEAFERDAVTILMSAWASGHPLKLPMVDIKTITNPQVLEVLDYFHHAQITPILFDCTLDTQVPTYMAYILDNLSRHVGVYRGYAAHLDPSVAMIKALMEAAQGRVIYIAGSRDDLFGMDYVRLKRSDNDRAFEFLTGSPSTIDANKYASQVTATYEGDIEILLSKVQQVGLQQVIAVDLTRPEMGVPVVKTIVPGFEGYPHYGYAPGQRALKFIEGLAL